MSKAYETLLQLGESLKSDPNVCCLLGLGSMSEIDRMDEFSDMDFFLIVEKGFKQMYIDQLFWIPVPIEFAFKNTKDGYKLLLTGDVFAEFAVFEADELESIAFTDGRVIYQKTGFDLNYIQPKRIPKPSQSTVEYRVNEALTNLYIGLKREHRGEKASAFTFIQVYAAGLITTLLPVVYSEHVTSIDPFVFERRIEVRVSESETILDAMKQGYAANKASAKAALTFLKQHFDVNEAMSKAIESLL